MKVLAFDCCFGAVSAVVRWSNDAGQGIMREAFETCDTGHAERLLPMIAEVMSAAGLDFGQLDRIAVTIGPGSFTGVRTGLATARGMALAAGLPIVGTTSLAILAARAARILPVVAKAEGDAAIIQRDLLVAVDARRGEFYVQRFTANGEQPLGDAALITLEQAAALWPDRALTAVGTGAEAIASACAEGRVVAKLPLLQPHARQLALIAPTLSPIADAKPYYLRLPDAKPSTAPSLRRSAS